MNPAALKANLADVPRRARRSSSTPTSSPSATWPRSATTRTRSTTASLEPYQVHAVDLTGMTVEALKDVRPRREGGERAKNMFALGLLSWMYTRPTEGTIALPRDEVRQAPGDPRRQHRRVQGGLELRRDDRGLRGHLRGQAGAACRRAPTATSPATGAGLRPDRRLAAQPGCRCSSGSYPITPASDILHELAKHKRFGVRTFQAEDEIAGIGAALGAAFGGALGVTTTSGPGVALKSETIGLAVSLELPLIVVDVQRGGPSTGLPTKTEQADLLQAMFGRNGEAPVPIVAPRSPGRLLRRRARGGPDRDDLPDAGVPALRRLPRQRLRAVADPGRRRPARPRRRVRDRARTTRRPTATGTSSGRTCATPRPWPARGRSPAPRASSTASAASRRPTARATSPTTPTTTTTWCALRAGEGRRHRASIPPLEVDDPSGDAAAARARLGLDLRADRRRRAAGSAQRGLSRSRRRTCATSTRSRPTRRGAARATTGCSCRR